MLVTAPVIARLTARSRFAINRAIKAGAFGTVHHASGRALRVELRCVEEVLGPIPPERLRAAGLRVSTEEVA
jgi:hypothetical protein